MIKLLLAYNADLSVLNKAKEKPVVFAANLQKWNCVIEFARAKKEEFTDAIVNGKYEYGHALLICAKANRYKAARALLQANATTNWYFPDKNTTALHHAAMNNTTAMVTLLMTSKADPNVKTLKGETPLQLATDNKFWTCALAFTKPERYLINEKEATALKMSLFYLFAAQCNPENKFHHVHFPVLKIILQIVYGYINSPDIYDFDTAKRYFVDLRPDRNFIRSATLFVDKFSSCGKLRQFVKAQSPESAEFADSLKKTIEEMFKK